MASDLYPGLVAYCLLVSQIMTKTKAKKVKPLHKTPVKEIPKPALDFDRDKNLSYLPQDESLDPLLEYPIVFETDVERPVPKTNRSQPQIFETDEQAFAGNLSTLSSVINTHCFVRWA